MKTALLVVLVASSLVLSARLWLMPAAARDQERYRTPFVVVGARGDVNWQELVQPLAIGVHLAPDRRAWLDPLDDANAALFVFLWRSLVELALAVDPEELRPVDPATLAAFYGDGESEAVGVDAVLPGGISLTMWRPIWQALVGTRGVGAPAAGTTPAGGTTGPGIAFLDAPIDRVAVFADPQRVHVLFRGASGYWGQSFALGELDPTGAGATARSLMRILTVTAGGLGLAPARLLDDVAGLRVARGILVPQRLPEPPLVELGTPAINWDRFARTVFDNPVVVRQVTTDELRIYTDGSASLNVHPRNGLVEYQVPTALQLPDPTPRAAGTDPIPSLHQALRAAVDFGNQHGGWPRGVFLDQVTILRQRGSLAELGKPPQPIGFRLRFAGRIEGLPVAGVPVVEADVGAGGVAAWRRRFYENRLTDRITLSLQPHTAAVTRIAGLPAESLPEASRVLRDVQLVYANFGDGFYKPTWRLQMHDGTQVWVDAWNVSLYRVLRPTP